jgi:hypothetical protein
MYRARPPSSSVHGLKSMRVGVIGKRQHTYAATRISRSLAFAISAEPIMGGGWAGPLPGRLIHQIDPDTCDLGLAIAWRQHLDRRVVGMDYRKRCPDPTFARPN